MYGPALRQLLNVLVEHLPAKKLDEFIRATGRRLAAEHRSAIKGRKLHDRVKEAIAILTEGGGACEPEKIDGRLIVRCYDCPLTMAAVGHPEICLLIETMLADLLDVRVKQRCEAEPSPQCCFEIYANGRK
jgi:predicted ArsR family transcriptional regulator